jgi:hypothetical protein
MIIGFTPHIANLLMADLRHRAIVESFVPTPARIYKGFDYHDRVRYKQSDSTYGLDRLSGPGGRDVEWLR